MRGIVLLCVLVLICASAEELVTITKGHGQGGKPKLIEKVFKNGVPSHLPLNKINEALHRGVAHLMSGRRFEQLPAGAYEHMPMHKALELKHLLAKKEKPEMKLHGKPNGHNNGRQMTDEQPAGRRGKTLDYYYEKYYEYFDTESCGQSDLNIETAEAICERRRREDPKFYSRIRKMQNLTKFFYNDKTEAARSVVLTEFCSDPCIKAVALAAADSAQHGECNYWEDLIDFGHVVNGICAKSEGKYCASEIEEVMKLEMDCPNYDWDEWGCKQYPDSCSWNATSYECTSKLTTTQILNALCTPCVEPLLKSDPGAALMCSKVSGEYCYPVLETIFDSMLEDSNIPFDAPTIDGICKSTVKSTCLQKFVLSGSGEDLYSMNTNYQWCVEYTQMNYTTMQQYHPYTPQECFEWDYADDYASVYSFLRLAGSLCTKNPAGSVCTYLAAENPTSPNTLRDACFEAAFGGTCNSTCSTEIQTSVTQLGCCLNELESFFFTPIPRPLPAQVIGGNITQSQLNGLSWPTPDYSFENLSACSSLTGLSTGLASPCDASTTTADKTMLLNIPYSSITATIRTMLINALANDISMMLGVLPSAVTNGALAEDTSFTVDGGKYGTKYTFKLSGKEWMVTMASAAYDERKSNNQLLATYAEYRAYNLHLTSDFLPFVHQTGTVTTPLPDTSIDLCYGEAFYKEYHDFYTTCNDDALEPVYAFFGDGKGYATVAAANTAFTSFCSGSCFDKTKAIVNSKYRDCLPDEDREYAKLFAIMCEKGSGGKYCGATLAQFYLLWNCSEYSDDESKCNGKGYCKFYNQTYYWGSYTYCDEDPTAAFLTGACNDCTSKLSAVFGGGSSSWEISYYTYYYDKMFCQKSSDGNFCYPQLKTEDILDDDLTTAQVTAICADRQKLQCINKVYGAQIARDRAFEREDFIHCVESEKYYSNNVTYIKQQIDEDCIPDYEYYTASIDEEEEKISTLCRKNADAKYCWGLLNATTDAQNACIMDALEDGNCTAACDATISGLMTTLGCCAGTVQQVYTSPEHLLPEEIPKVWGENYYLPRTATSAPASLTAGTGEEIVDDIGRGMLIYLGNCSSQSNINTTLRRVCAKTRATTTVKKTLTLKIAYSALENDPKLKEKILDALITDLAANLGVPKEDIVSAILVMDASVTVDGDKAGTKLEFTVQTQDATWTTEAGAQFDKMIEEKSMTLPSTVNVVDTQCGTACTGEDGATSIQADADQPSLETEPPPTTTEKKGGAATPFHASMILGALLVLLLA